MSKNNPTHAFNVDIEHSDTYNDFVIHVWTEDGRPLSPQNILDSIADVLLITKDNFDRSNSDLN